MGAYILWLEEVPIHREEEWSKYRVAAIKAMPNVGTNFSNFVL